MRTATTLLCASIAWPAAGCLPVPARAGPFAALTPPAVLIAMGTVDCRIETERVGGVVYVSGVVRSNANTVAQALMRVRRSGAAGQSDNAQGGVFAVGAGEEMTVGTVAINASPDDDLSAELTVEWDGGTASCSYP